MKKHLLLIIIVLSLNNIFAQQEKTFGIKGGLNLANINSDQLDDTDTKLGFSIGGFVNFPMSNTFSIQPEIFYSSNGYKSNSSGGETNIDYGYEYFYDQELTVSLNYIEVPILAVYSITKNLKVLGGPSMSFYLNGKTEADVNGYNKYLDNNNNWVTENFSENISSDIDSDLMNSRVFGLVLGAEYELNHFSFGARYSLGLSNILDRDKTEMKNRVFQFIIGYGF